MAHRVRLVGVQDAGYRAKSAHYRRLYVQGRPDRGPPPPGSRQGAEPASLISGSSLSTEKLLSMHGLNVKVIILNIVVSF